MKDSLLLEIFDNLTKKELRELRKFVRSPFHNQRKDVILLFDYLHQYKIKKPNLSITKEKVYPKLFPNEPFSEKKIRYTMSFLFQLIKDFLAIQELQNQQIHKQTLLLKLYRKKGIDRLFELEYKSIEKNLEKQVITNQEYHFQKFHLLEQRYFFNMRKKRGTIEGFKKSIEELDIFFIASKLRQGTHALTHQNLGHLEFDLNFFEEIKKYITEEVKQKSPAISVYHTCVQILTENDPLPFFKKLRLLINEKAAHFPKSELLDIYIFALNFCIRKLNERETSFYGETFELYKQGIEQEIFIENGILSRFNFKNIVALGLGLGEFNWVEEFINKYKNYLAEKHRESAYCLNMAMVEYRKQNYSNAMTLLQKVNTDDVLDNLSSRRMLTRIYYDLNEFDALFSFLDSFQNYIYRKKEVGYQKELYLNFIKFTRKLLQLETYTKAQIQSLRTDIEATKNIAEKVWLLEILDKARS